MTILKNHKFKFAGILLAGTILLGMANSANALDISIGAVRVQLPNGQVLSINDGDNWYHDQRVVAYKRYYYDPARRVYVVYNDNNPPRGWQRYHNHDVGYRRPHPQPHAPNRNHGPQGGRPDHGNHGHDDNGHDHH